MNTLPFANVSENVMLDKNRSQKNYCDINSLPSSNNDLLTDIVQKLIIKIQMD